MYPHEKERAFELHIEICHFEFCLGNLKMKSMNINITSCGFRAKGTPNSVFKFLLQV